MRSIILLIFCFLAASAAHAQKWTNFASISPTTNLVTNTLCYSDGRDLACDGTAGLLVTSGTVAFGNISATNISATTLNGKSINGGLGVSTLASLTDVSVSNKVSGSVLVYSGTTTSWTALPIQAVMSTTTMVPNWPDAIQCVNSGTPYIFYYNAISSGVTFYDTLNGTGAYIEYNSSGSYTGNNAGTAYDCVSSAYSISNLYSMGRAFNFIGSSGSSSNALGDRITSGTLVAVTNSATGYISLTTGSTTWGYLSSGVNYLPNLQTSTLSATVISATAIQLVSQTTSPIACNTGNSGTLRYNSPTTTLELCNGNGWQPMGVGIPAGTISAFASTTCPTGWSEYTAARGRFLRGIDSTGSTATDPSGTRAPGAIQEDLFRAHSHAQDGSTMHNANGAYILAMGSGYAVNTDNSLATSTASTGGAETRPVNVAVTFCQFNGTSNGWNSPLSTTAAGSAADVQYNSSGVLAADTGNFTYASGVMKAPTVSATNIYAKNVSATAGAFGSGGIAANGEIAIPTGVGNSIGVDAGNSSSNRGALAYTSYGVYCITGLCGGNQAWSPASDRRLKERVANLPEGSGLASILKLRAVTYHWRDVKRDQEEGAQIGFIAQEVAPIFPSLVVHAGKDVSTTINLGGSRTVQVVDPMSLKYETLVAPLVKAVQELKADNDNLRAEFEDYKRAHP